MKKILVLTVIAMLVIAMLAIVGFIVYITTGEAVEETPWEKGTWKQEISIKYVDGTAVVMSNLATVFHGGKEVSSIHYRLEVKMEGEGYQTAKFRFGNFRVNMLVDDTIVYVLKPSAQGSAFATVQFNNEFVGVIDLPIDIDYILATEEHGNYELIVRPIGTITYNLDDGEYLEVQTLPGEITTTLTVPEVIADDELIISQLQDDYGSLMFYSLYGQTFKFDSGSYDLTRIKLKLGNRVGNIDRVCVHLYRTTSNGFTPIGDPIATSEYMDGILIGTAVSLEWFEFKFADDNQYTMEHNTKYAFVLEKEGSASARLRIGSSKTINYPDGNGVVWIRDHWSMWTSGDLAFEIYGL